jgi:Domain of unknown function (DUF4159)
VGSSASRIARRALALASIAVITLAVASAAQRRYFANPEKNIPYDGKFTFVRVRYTPTPGGYWAGGMPSWVHGFPLAEHNLLRIMKEPSYLDMHTEEINVITLDDKELFQYPVAYIIEVGWWSPTAQQAANLRQFLLKGGFLIVDDFKPTGWRGIPGGGWEPFVEAIGRVLPEGRLQPIDPAHPIFHSFFEISSGLLANFPQAYNEGPPVFRAIFEDNDPRKRLMVMVNYNTDVSQYWEWSGRGLRPFDDTNEAYKLGVNYLIYGLTH